MKIQVHTLNSFTVGKKGGNPAGVVLDADTLSDSKMKSIAKKVGFSETAFISKSEIADYKIRFFTSKDEVDMCGHATIATAFLLKELEILDKGEVSQETKVGVLKVKIKKSGIFMEQKPPRYEGFVDRSKTMGILGISPKDVVEDMNSEIVSTGIRDIIVPIKSLKALEDLKPNLDGLSRFSNDTSTVGFHVFSLETREKGSTAYVRNFAPFYGIDEESATGSSNGSLACYLYKHGKIKKTKNLSFEQGYGMNMPSKIDVSLKAVGEKITEVWVGGSVVMKEKIEVSI